VAERAGVVLGFAGGGPARRPGPAGAVELYALNVDPGAWRSGVGSALLSGFEAWARAGRATALLLWVVQGNARARAFYERRGWRADGEHAVSEVLGATVTEVRYARAALEGG
jgi:GNAT superfamily N-acetyltransferase